MLKRRVFISAFAAVMCSSWTTPFAADFNVNSTADVVDKDLSDGVCLTATGKCTLRAAIMQANHSPDADVIHLPGGTYRLTIRRSELGGWDGELNDAMGDLDIFHSVTIRGDQPTNPANVVITARDANGILDRVFHVKGADQFSPNQTQQDFNVVFEGMTLTGGNQTTENSGGGAMLIAGSRSGMGPIPQVTIKYVDFNFNFSPLTGSGLSNWGGNVTVEDSTFHRNSSGYVPNFTTGFQQNPTPQLFTGGGIGGGIAHWGGEMTLRRVVLSENRAQLGGGIYLQDSFPAAKLVIEDSSIESNLSFMGAGVASFAGMAASDYGLSVIRTTISDNTAELSGGAIFNAGTLLLSNSTLSGNRAWDTIGAPNYPARGGGLYNSGRIVDIVNSTIAGNEAEEVRLTAATADASRGGDEIFFDYLNVVNNAGSSALSQRFTIKNSIIGNGPPTNPADPAFGTFVDDNCNGPDGYLAHIDSLGGNLDSGTTCVPPVFSSIASVSKAFSTIAPDLTNVSEVQLGLGGLSDNGSFAPLPGEAVLKTLALSEASYAIGMGKDCPGSDQRNFARTGTCDSGAFQVSVDPTTNGNAAPVAEDDVASVNIGQQIVIDVLRNDSDPDGGTILSVVSAANVSEIGEVSLFDGNVRYVAPSSAEGMVGSFPVKVNLVYDVSDGSVETQGQIIVWLYDGGENTPPVGVDDEFETGEGEPIYLDVLSNDSDVDLGDNARLVIFSENSVNSAVSDTTTVEGGNTNTITNTITNTVTGIDLATPNGSLRLLNDDTLFLYTPNEGFYGVDEFTYDVVDPRGGKTESVNVRVVVNKTPVIQEESVNLQVDAGGVVTGAISAIDQDSDKLVFFGLSGAKGDVELDEETGAFTYKAKSQVAGEDEFVVSVSDGLSVSSIVAKVLIVGGENTAPVGVSDFIEAAMGESLDINVVANDTDPDAADEGLLVISGEPTPISSAGGVIEKISDTSVRFTPQAGFVGQFQFSYVVEDAAGAKSEPTSVTLEVRANSAPVFLQSIYEIFVEAGSVYTGQVKANDSDGDPVTYTLGEGSKGSLTFDEQTGRFEYSARESETGVDEVLVTASDKFDETTAKIIVNVQAKSSSSVATVGGGVAIQNTQTGGGGGALGAFFLFLMGLSMFYYRGRQTFSRADLL